MPTLSDDDAALAVKALEHYASYLKAVDRDGRAYRELAERLKRKPVEYESKAAATQRKKPRGI
jgi:hypothetical protein